MKANADKDEDLRIIELRVANYRRLEAIRIRPDGTLVEITGKNGAGKTSAIGSIAWALGGKDFAEAMPLRQGQDEGEVFIDLGALRITKHATRGADDEVRLRLVVEFADGSRPKSPQLVLDELRGMLLDPIGFIRCNGAARIKMVHGLIPEFDFVENARLRKIAYDARTDVNREHKRAVAARDAIILPAGEKPAKVDVAKISQEIGDATKENAMIDARARNRVQAEAEADRLRDAAEHLRAQAREADEKAAALEAKIAGAEKLPEKIDTAALHERLRNADAVNQRASAFEQWEHRDNEAKRLHAQSATLSAEIDGHDDEKAKAVAGIKLPFKGLAIGADDIELDAVPFDQVAFSTRLRAAAALTMASEPRLKIMLIMEYGSLLDSDSKKLLVDLAEEQNFQVWMETISEGGPGKILIEDGRVKNA